MIRRRGRATLHLEQHVDPTPGQPVKQPMPIPLKTALIGDESGARDLSRAADRPRPARQSVTFDNVVEPPLLSINRGFSAPVIIRGRARSRASSSGWPRPTAIRSPATRRCRNLMMRALVAGARGEEADAEPVIDAIARHAAIQLARSGVQGRSDPAAERKPDRRPHGCGRSGRDPRRPRSGCGRRSARRCRDALLAAHRSDGASRRRSVAQAPRASGGFARSRLACSPPPTRRTRRRLAKAQFDAADNMTDRQGALGVLVSLEAPERQAALDAFYERFHDDPLVLDKWFALQAAAQRSDTVDQVLKLAAASRLHDHQPQPAARRWRARSAPITGRSTRATGAATPSSPT